MTPLLLAFIIIGAALLINIALTLIDTAMFNHHINKRKTMPDSPPSEAPPGFFWSKDPDGHWVLLPIDPDDYNQN